MIDIFLGAQKINLLSPALLLRLNIMRFSLLLVNLFDSAFSWMILWFPILSLCFFSVTISQPFTLLIIRFFRWENSLWSTYSFLCPKLSITTWYFYQILRMWIVCLFYPSWALRTSIYAQLEGKYYESQA